MRTTPYRIKRVHGGLLAFAEVSVRLDPTSQPFIRFGPDVSQYVPFRRALERGIEFAMTTHRARGGTACGVEVLSLVDLPADTLEDAVACAAAGATWKALGYSEREVQLVPTAEGWQVQLGAPAANTD